jgi:TRAP-type mannitol/chloroaromatic compound transport system permease large subunit
VLIVLADQLGRSVGDMYSGALIPGLLLVGLYLLFVMALAVVKPSWVPALPPEARIYREDNGASGHVSLVALLVLCAAAGWGWAQVHDGMMKSWTGRTMAASGDEVLIMSLTVASLVALTLAVVNKVTGMGLLSRLAQQVTFVLIPPLILIFLVLGTIFLGVATPTEGGAMGALGALIMALMRKRLDFPLLRQAMDSTARLSTFVLFILIGSTVFSFTFNAADGHIWVEHLFDDMPGGALGFLIVVNVLVFILGCFIDFFEIAFIVIPILAPVAEKILPEMFPPGTPVDAIMIWFGVVIAMNLQTSFLTPPFGFALFYLRSVAPKMDYRDRITKAMIPAVSTAQIYKGSIAFIVLQLIMVAVVIAFPKLVTDGIDEGVKVDADKALEQLFNLETPSMGAPTGVPNPLDPLAPPAAPGSTLDPLAPAPAPGGSAQPPADDPMKAILEAVKEDAKKK